LVARARSLRHLTSRLLSTRRRRRSTRLRPPTWDLARSRNRSLRLRSPNRLRQNRRVRSRPVPSSMRTSAWWPRDANGTPRASASSRTNQKPSAT